MKDFFIKHKTTLMFISAIILFFMGSLFQLIPMYIFDIDFDLIDSSNALYNPNITILLTIFSNLIILIILYLFYKNDLKEDLIKFKKNKSTLLDTGFKIWIIGLSLMVIFNIIINNFSPNEMANNEESIRGMLKTSPFLTLICTAILAPIIEEIVFRKSFRTVIKNGFLYVVISGFVFGGMHVLFSATNIYDYLYLLPYCSLGMALSYMYYKTNNIYVPITMHFIHNTITTLMAIFLR